MRTSRLLTLAASACALFALSRPVAATYITGIMTADNIFAAYLVPVDNQPDTQPGAIFLGSSNNWQAPLTLNQATLTPGVTYYLHVEATDITLPEEGGGFAGLLGNLSLSDASFQFANGTQTLVTETADWNVSLNNFNPSQSYQTPSDEGAVGVSPWLYGFGSDPLKQINSNAHWIWANPNDRNVTRYFSTTITPVAAPEPASLAVLALGGLALIARRRK